MAQIHHILPLQSTSAQERVNISENNTLQMTQLSLSITHLLFPPTFYNLYLLK